MITSKIEDKDRGEYQRSTAYSTCDATTCKNDTCSDMEQLGNIEKKQDLDQAKQQCLNESNKNNNDMVWFLDICLD